MEQQVSQSKPACPSVLMPEMKFYLPEVADSIGLLQLILVGQTSYPVSRCPFLLTRPSF